MIISVKSPINGGGSSNGTKNARPIIINYHKPMGDKETSTIARRKTQSFPYRHNRRCDTNTISKVTCIDMASIMFTYNIPTITSHFLYSSMLPQRKSKTKRNAKHSRKTGNTRQLLQHPCAVRCSAL